MQHQLLVIAAGVAAIFVLLGVIVWRNHKRDAWAAHDSQVEAERREAAAEQDLRRSEGHRRDQARRKIDDRRWDEYEAASDQREAALREQGPPVPWRVVQDLETGQWGLMKAHLHTPYRLRCSDRSPPSLDEIFWGWRLTRAVFNTLEEAQAFAKSAPAIGQQAYLLDAQGEIVKIEPTFSPDDEDDDA
ncbi:hypothetical protein BAMBUS_02650 [Brevundimonas phage vB_BpoS-Bambus]|nr:hypothetical protein BAMBUS_02650 [Brevundimonas phage vB_BpoS-Bambus]